MELEEEPLHQFSLNPIILKKSKKRLVAVLEDQYFIQKS